MNKNKGFFVTEAIIAIIVFTVGILGILNIQRESISSTSDAQYRVNAAYMTESIIGQIMLDKKNISNYVDGTNPDYLVWLDELKASMPGVATNPPEITTNLANGAIVLTVKLYWKGPTDETVSKYETETTIF